MSLWNLLPWSRRIDAAHSLPTSLLNTDRFLRILARERQRAERAGSTFCLLAMAPPKVFSPEMLAKIADILDQRLRITDECGLLADGRLGIVLSDTPVAGALKVASDVQKLIQHIVEPVRYHVYEYPGYSNRNDNSSGTKSTDEENCVSPMDAFFQQPLPLWKRSLDVIGASMLLVLTSPLMLAGAIAVKMSSPGPVFFIQKRDGLGGRPFAIYKFRTMRVGADAEKARLRAQSEQDGPAFKLEDDPRVTWVGSFLRKTSIDELPQLWNVLRGEMSLVGPRPLPCEESANCETWQRRRLDITPGLTCIWQVYGRSRVSFLEWIRMDFAYARARSLGTDLKLILSTIPAVLLRRGAK